MAEQIVYDIKFNGSDKAKEALEFRSSLILESIILPACIPTESGFNGESPFAISSALTNSLQLNISGKIVYEAVVFPAPFGPAMM